MSKNREKDSSQKTPSVEEQLAAASGRKLMTMDDVPFRFRPQAERIMKLAGEKAPNSFHYDDLQDKVAQYSRQEHPEKALDCLEEILKNPKITAAGLDHLYVLLEQFKIPGTEMYALELALGIFDSLMKNPSFSKEDFPDALQNLRIIFSVVGVKMESLNPLEKIIKSTNLDPSILDGIAKSLFISGADPIYYLTAASALLSNKDASDPDFLKKGFALLERAAGEPDWLIVSGACEMMQRELFNKEILDAIYKPFFDSKNKRIFMGAIENITHDLEYANLKAGHFSTTAFSPEEVLSIVKKVAELASPIAKTKEDDPDYRAFYAFTTLLEGPISPESFRIIERIYPDLAAMPPAQYSDVFGRVLGDAVGGAEIPGQTDTELFTKVLSLYWEGKKLAKKLGADYSDPQICLNFAFGLATLGKEKVIILNHEFGIEYFLRYPVAALNEQYENRFEKDTGKPLLVIAYNKSDWNGAFYKSRDNVTELSKHYRVVITEAGTEGDFYQNLERVSHKYGKIGTLVLGGHGSVDAIRLGKGKGESAVLDFTDEKALSKASMFFTDNPTVVLESCSTGKDEKAIGGLLSKVWGARLFAPKEPTSLSHFVFKKNGEIETVEYYKDEKSEFLKGKVYSKPAL